MKMWNLPVVILTLVLSIIACSSAPDPEAAKLLTDGYWHASLGDNDYIYELHLTSRGVRGTVHMIQYGRQLTESPITGVSLDGDEIEMRITSFPPYSGKVDLAAGRITGGHPDAGAYEDMNLTKVAAADWPMVPERAETAYRWTEPSNHDDGWVTAAPAEVGIDSAAIDALVAAIIAEQAGALHSLLVVREGRLVVEEYFHGWQPDDLHRIASCTKSLSSLLVGIAIDRGEIEGVDVPLLDFFPERRSTAGDGWEKIRLEHLLTMSMGLDWNDREAEGFSAPGEDRFAEVLGRNVRDEPGTSWRYVSRNTNLLSAIIQRATGKHADIFASEQLFEPLGIDEWDWENSKYEGHPGMSGTLKMRPRDMAKIGQLVLDRGSWKGRQLVSSEWIEESTKTRFTVEENHEYGYLWWGLDEPQPGGADIALGLGSQYIAVVPDHQLVLVTTGGNDYNGKQPDILGVAKRHLLPGLQ
jgi:CubicO group peptidase (beta-lactamase class C family)